MPLKPLTRPREDHLGIRERYVQTTYRRELEEAVRHVSPMPSGIGGLPHSAVGGAEIEDEGIVGISRHRNDTPATERPHETPLEGRKKVGTHAGILGEDDFGASKQNKEGNNRRGKDPRTDSDNTRNRIHRHLHRIGHGSPVPRAVSRRIFRVPENFGSVATLDGESTTL